MKIVVYTDGASRGNPGKSSYGFSIQDNQGKVIFEEGKFIGIATNNFAEYSGVLNALKHIEKELKKISGVTFYMDSKLVAEQLSGRFKIKSPNLRPLIVEIKKLEEQIGSITYNHIPRNLNSTADALANKALDIECRLLSLLHSF